ncbi:MAG: Reverse transcriptase (RNA-dependent DNA polymerase) [Halomonas sp. HL-48]|nr:reverse transcriptase domain-containing protein [Halomonas sp. HL-48]KPQ25226.1 MAG: Reverse transcriptase (RNA-dependent DNA polymerase) [Halomonas sp. HL-48]
MDVNIQKFLNIESKAQLSAFLGISTEKLNYLLFKLPHEEKYNSFEISKKTGGKRIIDAPIKPLKLLQRQIATILFEVYKPKTGVYGYVKNGGVKRNAEVHLRSKVLFRADIKNFFPSIHIGRVIGLFSSKPFSFPRNIAVLLAQICCKEDVLPQGSPASPIISNFICRGLDRDLLEYARSVRCKYSRYADDIFISTYKKFMPGSICKLEHDDGVGFCNINDGLEDIFETHGFSLNKNKLSVAYKHNRQIAAGIKINEKLNVDREYVLNLRAMLHSWRKDGYDVAAAKYNELKPNPSYARAFKNAVRSKLEYLGYVKGYGDPVYLKYAMWLSRLDDGYTFNKRSYEMENNKKLVVYTEGVTDQLHIQAAKNYFREKGEFMHLDFRFDDKSEVNGAPDLEKYLIQDRKEPNQEFKVYLFDDDLKKVTSKLDIAPGESSRWFGNKIWAALTPKPQHRKDDELFCIEMYYFDADLERKDSSNRRIYLNSEFDAKGFHNTESVVKTKPGSGLIVDNDAYSMVSKEKVSLSKIAFAENILYKKQGFEDVNFEGFRPLFELLQNIYNQAYLH